MEKLAPIQFHTANTAATHLGRKLYTSSPSALAELVANSYDAYATQVWLSIEQQGDTIIVADNGIGMSLESIRSNYASIGHPKPPTTPPPNRDIRKPMGKKGIGKLASFSLGDEFTVYTKTSNDSSWITFKLQYSEMIDEQNAQSYDAEVSLLECLPDELEEFDQQSGFIVVINNLWRKITKSTLDGLDTQLSRRFSLRNSNFEISLNGNLIKLSPTEVLYQYVQAANYVGFPESEIRSQFPNAKDLHAYHPNSSSPITERELDELVEEKGIKGWLGVVDKPARLSDISLSGILVYINGKIADEDLLKDRKSAQLGGRYVTGEIHANYLNDQDEDPITSSRQGLSQADDEVLKILKLVTAMEGRAIAQWDSLRDKEVKSYIPDSIKNDTRYISWHNRLSRDQKKFHHSLFRLMSNLEDFGENDWMTTREKIGFINSATFLVDSYELLEIDQELLATSDTQTLFTLITHYLGNLARKDRLQMLNAANARLGAIKHLKELLQTDNLPEKVFEDCLFDNPWLLNPFWNRSIKSKEEIHLARQRFVSIKEKKDNPAKKRGFIDIYVEVAEKELPIVVELKRHDGKGHSSPSKVTMPNIFEQIDFYRKLLITELPRETRQGKKHNDIEAIFIAPKNAILPDENLNGLDESNIETLKQAGITIRTYEDLLRDAQISYRDFFEAQESSEDLPFFSNDTHSDH